MVGWHHWLGGHEFERTLGDGDGQGSLACCSPWGCKKSDMTAWVNWTEWSYPLCLNASAELMRDEREFLCRDLLDPLVRRGWLCSIFFQTKQTIVTCFFSVYWVLIAYFYICIISLIWLFFIVAVSSLIKISQKLEYVRINFLLCFKINLLSIPFPLGQMYV